MIEKKKKQDLILIATVLGISCTLFIGKQLLFRHPGTTVEISVDGNVFETLPLNKDAEITIPGDGDGTNHLMIKDGTAYVDEASCPDRVCIHQGKIHQPGELIVCLPNKMIAKIVEEAD